MHNLVKEVALFLMLMLVMHAFLFIGSRSFSSHPYNSLNHNLNVVNKTEKKKVKTTTKKWINNIFYNLNWIVQQVKLLFSFIQIDLSFVLCGVGGDIARSYMMMTMVVVTYTLRKKNYILIQLAWLSCHLAFVVFWSCWSTVSHQCVSGFWIWTSEEEYLKC